MSELRIRRLQLHDDMVALTELIHRSYAPLAAKGMRYWGSHQSVADTIDRCAKGETWLAERDGQVVGTITLHPAHATAGCPTYNDPHTGKFQQFCVDPTCQGQGIGGRLMDHIEQRAVELGLKRLALDTSEHAAGLIRHYARLGYTIVDRIDYRPTVNYRSVVLAKVL
jgi:GNAT superfamily N-acetyltransferase